MTLLERYCAWSIEELNDETGLYTEEKLMVALDNIAVSYTHLHKKISYD